MCPGCSKRTPLELSEELSAEIKKTLKDLCGIDLADSLLFACSYCDCVTDSGKRRIPGSMKGTGFQPSLHLLKG